MRVARAVDRGAPRLRAGRRRGRAVSAASALAVLAVAFAAAWSATPGTRTVSAASQFGPVVIEVPQFGTTGATRLPPPAEVANATVVNNTATGLHISGITVGNAEGVTLYSAYGPDTCSDTVLAAGAYCVVGLRDANPGDADATHDGLLVVHTLEQKNVSTALSNNRNGFYTLRTEPDQQPPPSVYSFGSLVPGTSSGAQTVTVADVGTDVKQSGYITQVLLTGANPGDFSITSDGCTGHSLGFTLSTGGTVALILPQTCPVTVVARPAAAGQRTAWLDVTYCPFRPDTGSATLCAEDRPFVEYALHLLVRLTVTGVPPTPPSTPTPPVTSNPPPGTSTPPPGTFSPKLTTSPEVVPAGRLTLVSGTGFPAGRPVTVAMLPLGGPPLTTSAALAVQPQAASTKTDGAGAFRDLPLVVMAHTPPGTYPLEAIADGPGGPVAVTIGFLVVPGTEQPPQFVNRH